MVWGLEFCVFGFRVLGRDFGVGFWVFGFLAFGFWVWGWVSGLGCNSEGTSALVMVHGDATFDMSWLVVGQWRE